MLTPIYTITSTLLSHIKQITKLVSDLNTRRFPSIILYELEKTARAVSTYASTSIEGNPLPLTDVKQLIKSHPKNLRASELEVINYNRALIYLNNLLKQKKQSLHHL